MENMLFIGKGEARLPNCWDTAPNQSCVGTKALGYGNGALTFGLFSYNLFTIFGFNYTVLDLIKGVLLGAITHFAIEPMFNSKSNKIGQGFKRGFIVGGAIGGFEDAVDDTVGVIEGYNNINDVSFELFQSVLMQGVVAGLVNALLAKV